MDRLLARLERTFLGRLAVERLITFIVGGMAMVFVLGKLRPTFVLQLYLVPALAFKQPWRLVTFLFLPDSWSLIWIVFSLYFTWMIGNALEQEWGAFKLNVFYAIGILGTIGAALVTGEPQTNLFLNLTLYFAFATLFPDFVIRLLLIIPIRIKWLAMLGAAGIIYQFIVGDLGVKAAIGAAFANYFLFFGGHLVRLARGRRMELRQSARRTSMRDSMPSKDATDMRQCAICGVRQVDGADIRVCSCEKCGGPRALCLEHARSH